MTTHGGRSPLRQENAAAGELLAALFCVFDLSVLALFRPHVRCPGYQEGKILEIQYVVSESTQSVLRYHGPTGAFLGLFASGELRRPTWLVFSPPEAPTNLTAVPFGSLVRLSWTDNSDDEIAFDVERKAGTDAFTLIGRVSANITSLIDTGVVPGTPNTYRVRALGPTGPSGYANTAEVTVFVGGTLRVERQLVLPRTAVGGTSAQTLFVQNIGAGVLAGSVESLSPPFSLFSGGGRFVLSPRQRLPVVAGFSPVAPGVVNCTLVITSTDPRQPAVYVQLTGEGIPAGG